MLNYSESSETSLVDQIQRGDQLAFAEFYSRNIKKLHAMAYSRVQSAEIANEIIQELFISLWEKRASIKNIDITSYLYVGIKNKAINYIHSQLVKQRHSDFCKRFLPQSENLVEDEVAVKEIHTVVETGLSSLPEKTQKVFRLNRLEGKSKKDIAELLNLSEKAIEYHLTQSLKHLRLHLKDYIMMVCISLNTILSPLL